MKDSFSKMHPFVNFVYYTTVILLSMFIMNPVCLFLSLSCAVANAVYLNGKKSVLFGLKFVLPTVLTVSLINPVVNHRGTTVLFYLPWNNPFTLESVIFGVASSVMVGSVVFWFSSVNTVMTSDKFVYLFGRIIPSLSLVLTMSLRFVPKFTAEWQEVKNAQRLMGKKRQSGFLPRLKEFVRTLSVMLSRTLEGSIETADSMKARGYGLKGRTAFSVFRFTRGDLIFLVIIVLLTGGIITSRFLKTASYSYFPTLKVLAFSLSDCVFYVVYAALLLMPLILNIGEEYRWRKSQQSI